MGLIADYSFNRPDFVLNRPDCQAIVAEATIASHADGYNPEWDRNLKNPTKFELDEVLHIATIRLANSIWAKYRKLKSEYSQLTQVRGKPFVICVAPFEQPYFFAQNDHAIRRVLYGFDQPLWLESPNGDRIHVGESSLPEIIKDNGSAIPLGFFASRRLPEVSAVIFSTTATTTKLRALTNGKLPVMFHAVRYNANATKPHLISQPRPHFKETLLDGLHVLLNPFADHPLDLTPFEGRELCIHFFDPETGAYEPVSPDGFLIQHGSMVLTSGAGSKKLAEVAKREYKRPVLPDRPDGELFPVPGHVMMFVDNHLAYHRGWTICVARDSIDNDWMAQGTKGRFATLASYHVADKSQYLIIGDLSYPSKEEAFAALTTELDRFIESQPAFRSGKLARTHSTRAKRQAKKQHRANKKRR